MKKLYKISKWLHKWSSIIISILLIWMSISGIILNHPELISEISVPKWLLPDDYDLKNWNRSSLIQAENSINIPQLIYFCGNEGVVKSTDGGFTFQNLNNNGFPKSAYNKRTKSIALFEFGENHQLFAGTFSGLFVYNSDDEKWTKLNFDKHNNRVMKLIKYNDSLIVSTDSELYISAVNNGKYNFRKIELNRIDDNPKMSMIEFFFQLHSGELWGLPGKIVFDIGGFILLFLSVSGLYLWLSPKYRRFKLKLNLNHPKNHTRWFYKNHLMIGIWSFIILLIFAVTGLFMRPPLIAALLGNDIAYKYLPVSNPENYWKHRIRNATFNPSTNRFVIDTKDGYWVSDKGLYGHYSNQLPPVPIFAMGATVLENDDDGHLLIGSFAGLYRVTNSGYYAENVIDKDEPMVSSVRPGANLITGYFKDQNGREFVTTHFGGLLDVQNPNSNSQQFKMPEFLKENYSMSLWNYLFEIHNGRIFQAIIGEYYILIIPLASLIFIIVIITGVFDWLYLKFK